jgi:hypothetical protein
VKQPVIFDCDGVLLRWEAGFAEWCKRNHGLILEGEPQDWDLSLWTGLSFPETMQLVRDFNASTDFGGLAAERHAQDVVLELWRKGHPLFLLSSCGRQAKPLREKNIERRFGRSMFSGVFCVDLGESKAEQLEALYTLYGACWWVEDNVPNAELGRTIGHNAICLARDHNRNQRNRFRGIEWAWCLPELLSLIS